MCFVKVLVLCVLVSSVLAEDTPAEAESSRTSRFNRNERPMLKFKPSGQMTAQDRVIMERFMNNQPRRNQPSQTMQRISPFDSTNSNSPSVSNNFVHSKPSARVVVSGPGRIILHASPNSASQPRPGNQMHKVNQHNSPPPKHYPQTTTKRLTYPQSTPSQNGQHHFNMNNNNNGPRIKVNPIPIKREEFRPSQPIPVFEKIVHPHIDLLSDDRFHSKIQTDITSANSPKAYSYASIKHYVHNPDPSLQFTASDNVVDEFENTWQPAMPSPGYVPGIKSTEVQQYHSQERISFYPDKHPEYFQPLENDSFNAVKPSISTTGTSSTSTTTARPLRRKPQSSSRFQAGNSPPKKQSLRKPYQFKKLSTTTPEPSDDSENINKDSVFQFNDSLLKHNAESKIKPVYEYHSDEQLPSKRYGDADAFDTNNDSDDQIYQSVLVSSSLLTSAEHSDNAPAMFITPSKPDLTEVDRTTTAPTTTAPTTQRSVRGRPLRKHNRVFKRKFVAPPSSDTGSCEESCLSNIVNHEYDPVCGSDNKTYANVGRLRCTKICGEHQLHVAHFGNCESSNNTLEAA